MKKALLLATAALVITPSAARAADWQDYVLAPQSRVVAPQAILHSSDGVTNAAGLLAPGGGAAHLQSTVDGTLHWPAGTTATASSFHAPNTNNGQPRTYAPGNAIDGDTSTFWNDDTIGAYPDVLTITAPSAVSLPGVTLMSSSDGVPQDFTVDSWNGSAWVNQATVTGNTDVTRAIRFAAPVSTTQLRLTITRDQNTPSGEFSRVAELQPGIVTAPYIDIDFGQELSGKLEASFSGASTPAPQVRFAFSETQEYLGFRSDFSRSDFSNGDGTDDVNATAGQTWHDDGGLRGFRYVRIYLGTSPASVDIDDLKLNFTPYLGTPDTYTGHFLSSDDRLNKIWYASTYTVELDTDTFTADSIEPRGAFSPTLDGKRVIQDGAKRDRDPYVGDLAVSDLTNLVSHADTAPITNVLGDLADHQRADGWIPPASINNYTLPLFDYPAWWVVCDYEYALYSGDTAFVAKYWPTVVKVLNSWYPSQTDANGLLNRTAAGGYGDYAFLPRTGEVAYYNVLYVRALRDAAKLATQQGDSADASAWNARAASVSAAVNARLWDASAGAYKDSDSGTLAHPEDANSIAVLAGVADSSRTASALSFLSGALQRPWGNAFVDNNAYGSGTSDRVYAFLNYPEVSARFDAGQDASALELLRRTWGWMLDHDPTNTTWEGVGAGGDVANYEGAYSSMAHGWGSGAAPALTNDVLGITPTGLGFSTYDVIPHPGDVTWAQGTVPTPQGQIAVAWERHASVFSLSVSAPAGTGRIGIPTGGRTYNVVVDGAPATTTTDGRYDYVTVGPGSHCITASSPSDTSPVGGTVPATLSLTLGAPVSFGVFTPFVARDYTASTTATVTSTAGDATLRVTDPGAFAGHLLNGAFVMPQPLRWDDPVKTWSAPASNDVVPVGFHQAIAATDALRSGNYTKTLTFTLSTTNP